MATSSTAIVKSHTLIALSAPESVKSNAISSSRSLSGSSPFSNLPSKNISQSHNAPKVNRLHVTSATQIFRLRKKDDDDEEKEAPKKPAFGTQVFRFQKKAKEAEGQATKKETASKSVGLIKISPENFPGLQVFQRGRQADPNTVFVAGATGQTGARVSLELLHAGFKVRAGVSDLAEAQKLAEIAATYGLISKEEAKNLNVVEFNGAESELTAKAIGNAGKVVVTVGDGEGGPDAKITNKDALVVVKAAEMAKVNNLILISNSDSISSSSSESPLNFFAKIFAFFSRQRDSSLTTEALIEKIAETKLNFTVLKTASSAGVSDSYSASTSVVVSEEGKGSAGKISKLQIAGVVASALSNTDITENKVFDVVAIDGDAKPINEYFSAVPLDSRRSNIAVAKAKLIAEEKEKAEKAAAFAEAEAAKAEAEAAAKLAKTLELEAKKLAEEEVRAAANVVKTAAQAKAANASVQDLSEKVKEVEQALPKLSSLPSFNFSEIESKFKAGTQKVSFDRLTEGFDFNSLTAKLAPKQGSGSLKEAKPKPVIEKVKPVVENVKSVAEPAPKPTKRRPTLKPRAEKPVPKPAPAPAPPKPVEKRKVLGGLFEQETVFVDDE